VCFWPRPAHDTKRIDASLPMIDRGDAQTSPPCIPGIHAPAMMLPATWPVLLRQHRARNATLRCAHATFVGMPGSVVFSKL